MEGSSTMSTTLKGMRTRKLQIVLSLIVAVVLSVTVLFGSVVRAADDDFAITPSIKKNENCYVFNIEVKNKGKAFDGRVVVMNKGYYSGYTGYSKKLSIAAEATEYASINVPVSGTDVGSIFYIYICDNSDEIVYKEKFTGIQEYVGIKDTSGDESRVRGSLDFYDIETYQGYMDEPAGKLSGVISILIVLYVALVGPGLYLILKAINKRELLWIVIPGTTLVFVLIMFLMGLSSNAKGESVKSIDMTNYVSKKQEAYIFGYASSPQKWSIKTKENYVIGSSLESGYYDADIDKLRVEIEEGMNNMILSYTPNKTYKTVCYELESAKPVKGAISIKLDKSDPSKLNVKNDTGYDLDYLYVSTYSGYEILENVKNGEEKSVNCFSISGQRGSVYNRNEIERDCIRPAYEENNYNEASELAAMLIGIEASFNGEEEAIACGITKGNRLTDKNDLSYKCFYDASLMYPREDY